MILELAFFTKVLMNGGFLRRGDEHCALSTQLKRHPSEAFSKRMPPSCQQIINSQNWGLKKPPTTISSREVAPNYQKCDKWKMIWHKATTMDVLTESFRDLKKRRTREMAN